MTQNTKGSCVLLLAAIVLAGCDKSDRYKRAADIAEKAAERQAQQNAEMVRLNREVAEGTRRLVESDADARKEIIGFQQDLQAERASLTEGFDALEVERKDIAQQRRTESVLVPVAKALGLAIVAVVVVGFCWTLLFGLRHSDSTDVELNDLLIRDLVRDHPKLLAGLPRKPSVEVGRVDGEPQPPRLGQAGPPPDEPKNQGGTT